MTRYGCRLTSLLSRAQLVLAPTLASVCVRWLLHSSLFTRTDLSSKYLQYVISIFTSISLQVNHIHISGNRSYSSNWHENRGFSSWLGIENAVNWRFKWVDLTQSRKAEFSFLFFPSKIGSIEKHFVCYGDNNINSCWETLFMVEKHVLSVSLSDCGALITHAANDLERQNLSRFLQPEDTDD